MGDQINELCPGSGCYAICNCLRLMTTLTISREPFEISKQRVAQIGSKPEKTDWDRRFYDFVHELKIAYTPSITAAFALCQYLGES